MNAIIKVNYEVKECRCTIKQMPLHNLAIVRYIKQIGGLMAYNELIDVL